MLRQLRLRLRAIFHRDDAAMELQAHLDQLTDSLIAEGMTPTAARGEARRRFGNVGRIQEQSHDLWTFRVLEDLLADVRYAMRSLRRNPSVAVAAVLSMGLAIGVNTGVFSLVHEIFLAKPTVPHADRLAMVRLGGNSHSSLL